MGWSLQVQRLTAHTLLSHIEEFPLHMQGGAGSVLPVSVQECEIACEMAQPECTSFSYNPTLTACFLKQGGTRATCNSPATPCYEANQNLQVPAILCTAFVLVLMCSTCNCKPLGAASPCVQL